MALAGFVESFATVAWLVDGKEGREKWWIFDYIGYMQVCIHSHMHIYIYLGTCIFI